MVSWRFSHCETLSLPEKTGLVAPVHFINNHAAEFVLFLIVRWEEFGYSCSQAAERERRSKKHSSHFRKLPLNFFNFLSFS